MRIVAGKFAGRDLTSPNDFRVHPTAERVRAAMLDAIAEDVPQARVLDLFAGTGALGLEAISRGARSADFVEFRPASLHALKANVAALKLRERTRIFKKDAMLFLTRVEAGAYDITFADPPYTSRLLERVVATWRERQFSRILAVEHAAALQLPPGAHRKRFEDTAITIYRL